MHLVVHDYSGHPFQVQLSRELAARGHWVTHQHCSSYATGKGAVSRLPGDPETFDVQPFSMTGAFARYAPAKRIFQEVLYGAKLGRSLRKQPPEVVVMCNIPLLAHRVAAAAVRARGIPMVFWQQDVYSDAISTAARLRLGRTGAAIGSVAVRMERWIARNSNHVVPISESFIEVLRGWGVEDAAVTAIPNWAALEEMPLRPKDNAWARTHGLHEREVVLYSGTLGLKHDPQVLSELATTLMASRPEARVVVVSEGQGRQWLEGEKRRRGLDNLVLLDYQPYEDLPDLLATGDVLVTVLEPEASRYSVPSKVLNYLCAGRPILGVMPAENNAATSLVQSGAGVVVPPGQAGGVVTEVLRLLSDADLRSRMGAAGRRHAETYFDIKSIGDQFEAILMRVSADASLAPSIDDTDSLSESDSRGSVEAKR